MAHRELKDHLYPQVARIGQALASEKRLELVDLLAQSPRHVDALASETNMSVANVSQHLHVLRAANLLDAERRGNMTVYRLADPAIAKLWLSIRDLAESRLAEIREIAQSIPGRENGNVIARDDVRTRLKEAVLLDVRPRQEFEAGHLRGAINIPIDELADRMNELPKERQVITYCRGRYCLFADEAADLLRNHGFNVVRLEGGWPEWQAEGRPVSYPR